MEVLSLVENKDGSANMNVDLTAEEHQIFLQLGIVTALKLGIDALKEVEASSSNIKNETIL